MLEVEIKQAFERYEDRLREAEEYRLYRSALAANGGNGHLRKRVAAQVGTWMIAAGRRLGAQDGPTDPTPSIRYARVHQQLVASLNKTIDCGPDGKLAGEGRFRKVA
jgi:hypothetical protein